MLLSLIVPVYKAEKYIEACLYSVFRQIHEEVEVILVNDGTPDSSMDIVNEKFGAWIDRGTLILLEQGNMGPGAARNTGVRKASGHYIAFLDSDDVALDGYFDEVMGQLRSCTSDIIEFGFKRFRDLADISRIRYRPLYGHTGFLKLSEVREQVFGVGCWYPSIRIYRRLIIEQFPFPEGTHYEDLMTIPFIYLQDYTVLFIDKPLLGYRYNPESITSLHTRKQLSEKYCFYKSISRIEQCESVKILRLKTLRGMFYFQSELRTLDFPVNTLIEDVRSLSISPESIKYLRFPDRFLLFYPKIYVYFERIRVPVKNLFLRIRKR